MKAKKCGCYDGPYSTSTPSILVSVRCVEHVEKFAKPGHSLMHKSATGVIVSIAPRDTHSKRELTLAAQRKRNAERSHKFSRTKQKKG